MLSYQSFKCPPICLHKQEHSCANISQLQCLPSFFWETKLVSQYFGFFLYGGYGQANRMTHYTLPSRLLHFYLQKWDLIVVGVRPISLLLLQILLTILCICYREWCVAYWYITHVLLIKIQMEWNVRSHHASLLEL